MTDPSVVAKIILENLNADLEKMVGTLNKSIEEMSIKIEQIEAMAKTMGHPFSPSPDDSDSSLDEFIDFISSEDDESHSD